MEANRRYYDEFEYVEGNTARKLNAMPDNDYQREMPVKREQQVRRSVAKREQQAGIDLVSLLFLSVAIIVTMYVCVEYLQVQNSITSQNKHIVTLENEVMEMKNDNATALDQVTASVDLAYVYEVATKQLGMVHANSNQVINYTSVKSDYVRQYDNIPSSDKSDFLDYVFRSQK